MSELLDGMTDQPLGVDCTVSGLSMDSRSVHSGSLFLACRGENGHGEAYIEDALHAGATAIAVDSPSLIPGLVPDLAPSSALDLPPGLPLVRVPGLRRQAGVIADRFFGSPSRDLRVLGVTGTNGKTTVTQLVAQALAELCAEPRACGLIGTLGYGFAPTLTLAGNTTPDAVTVHRLLHGMRLQGARFAALEVSSHALEQDRVNGVHFDAAVLTCLGSDHLDYHGSLERYAASKRRLFHWPGLRSAAVNMDDELGRQLHRELQGPLRVIGYRLASDQKSGHQAAHRAAHRVEWEADAQPTPGQVCARIVTWHAGGMEMELHSPWGSGHLSSALFGIGNAYNLLAAATVLGLYEQPFAAALQALGNVPPLPGRMERFVAPARPLVVVDYAHTPDALEQALCDLRTLHPKRLYCMFGCGGERDQSKRSRMGAIATRLADQVVLTSDNPRREDPTDILQGILAGISDRSRVQVEVEREQALAWTLQAADAADIILIAGKGHEEFQEIEGVRRPLSDRAWVREWMGL